MSLSHDGFAFLSALHTRVEPETPYDIDIGVRQFAGVQGELHLVDETKGRNLFSLLTASGYATPALLEAALQTIHAKAGKLTGTLTADGTTYVKCTFIGIEPIEPAFQDGSGANGWVQRVRLRWRQRDRT